MGFLIRRGEQYNQHVALFRWAYKFLSNLYSKYVQIYLRAAKSRIIVLLLLPTHKNNNFKCYFYEKLFIFILFIAKIPLVC